MSLLADWWEANATTVISSIITLLLGILGSYFLSHWFHKAKKPRYAFRSVNLIANSSSTFPDLQIHYKGYTEPFPNITVTLVSFWNAGYETINKQDIVKTEPLVIKAAKDNKIIDVKITKVVKEANNFTCSLKNDNLTAVLSFDYVDRDQGAMIQVFHTGLSSDDINVEGTIKGAGSPIRMEPSLFLSAFQRRTSRRRHTSQKMRTFAGVVSFLLSLPVLALAVYIYSSAAAQADITPAEEAVLAKYGKWQWPFFDYVASGLFLCVFLTYFCLGIEFLRRRMPQGLDPFEEDLR